MRPMRYPKSPESSAERRIYEIISACRKQAASQASMPQRQHQHPPALVKNSRYLSVATEKAKPIM